MTGWVILTLALAYVFQAAPVTRPIRKVLSGLPLVGRFFADLFGCLPCVSAWAGLCAGWWIWPVVGAAPGWMDGLPINGWWVSRCLSLWILGSGVGFGVVLLSPLTRGAD